MFFFLKYSVLEIIVLDARTLLQTEPIGHSEQ